MSDGDTPKPETALDKVKVAILDLPAKDQHKIYQFLYALGHRINQ